MDNERDREISRVNTNIRELKMALAATREIARRKLHKVFKAYLKTGVLPRGIG